LRALHPNGDARGAHTCGRCGRRRCGALWFPGRPGAVLARHREFEGERTGARCRKCDIWRWLPISRGEVPIDQAMLSGGGPVLGSKEFSGDGHQSFRHLVFRRDLADILVVAYPKVWRPHDIQVGAN
jgi:hypothetical protein